MARKRGLSAETTRQFNAAARRINRLAKKMKTPLGMSLRMIGEEIMTDVKASRPGRGVPRDTGALASTGRVVGPIGARPKVTLSFGGAAAPYALEQHEILTYYHDVGEARYLVRGMQRWKPGGSAAMAALRANARAGLRAVAEGRRLKGGGRRGRR